MKNNLGLSRRCKALGLAATMLATAVAGSADFMSKAPNIAAAADPEYNYAKALQYSIYFYDANMCGTEVEENNLYSWRGDCHTYDAKVPLKPMGDDSIGTNLPASFIAQYEDILDPDGDGFVDVAGGFHDAGDHVKFGMPENYSASTLGWGYYEFRDAYAKLGQDDHIETILRYFNDYLMKCTFRKDNGDVIAHCYQVGDGDIDHAYWNSPEIDEMARPAFFLTEDKPQTDYAVSAAASLAINYLNFKDTDPEYAEQSLDYAKALFRFAQSHPKELSDNGDGPKSFYGSSKWEDDYCWAAAWLFKITGEHEYLEEIYPNYDYYAAPCYVYCWNDVWSGVQCILGEISQEKPLKEGEYTYPGFIEEFKVAANKSPYEEMDCWASIEKALTNYMTGGLGTITPEGYFWLNTWGSARYNTAAQLVALVYDKYQNGGKPSKYSEWAQEQMQYLMGKNELGRSYIVGYNETSAKFPHHRAASGLTKCEDLDPHRYVLYGALVGGPDATDQHNDITKDWIYNEVTIDYNAAFVGASAGLYEYFGTEDMQITPDFPPPPVEVEVPGGSNRFWVDAFYTQIDQTDGPKANEISLFVRTTSNKPAKDVSIRYFFDTSEMTSVSKESMEIRQLYDQTATETTDYAAELSGPFQYKDTSIYYLEVSWPGFAVANSNKKYQFAVGTYSYGNKWDPTNDWSLEGMMKVESNWFEGVPEEAPNVCVYNEGVLIGGTEPDGSTAVVETTAPVTGTTSVTTTTTTKVIGGGGESDFLYGDVDSDEMVSVSDIIKLARYVAEDEDSKPLDATQKKAADCNGDGVIDAADISLIARYIAKLLPSLGPEK